MQDIHRKFSRKNFELATKCEPFFYVEKINRNVELRVSCMCAFKGYLCFQSFFHEISGVFAPFTNEVKSILAHFLNSCFRQVFVVSTKNDSVICIFGFFVFLIDYGHFLWHFDFKALTCILAKTEFC